MILIASGSEVQYVVGAYEQLVKDQVPARVVSMPSWELFEKQSKEYRDSVITPSIKKRLVVEASVAMGWHKYVGDEGVIICMTGFGASAPYELLYKEYGFTVENVVEKARAMLG
jgi:transketolase